MHQTSAACLQSSHTRHTKAARATRARRKARRAERYLLVRFACAAKAIWASRSARHRRGSGRRHRCQSIGSDGRHPCAATPAVAACGSTHASVRSSFFGHLARLPGRGCRRFVIRLSWASCDSGIVLNYSAVLNYDTVTLCKLDTSRTRRAHGCCSAVWRLESIWRGPHKTICLAHLSQAEGAPGGPTISVIA